MSARIDGIDLSHWRNSALDLARAKAAGVRFVVHKATEGASYVDPNYDSRRVEVAHARLVFGAYHFAQAGDAAAQARHFLAVARPKAGDLRPALDLEAAHFADMSVADRTAWVGRWVRIVKDAVGVTPLIYTPFDLADNFGCPPWVARYSNAMYAPRIPKPWRHYAIWQFSNGVYGTPRTVPGVGHCDIDTLGAGVSLAALRIPSKEDPVASSKTRVEKGRDLIAAGLKQLDATPKWRVVVHARARAIRRELNRLPKR